MFIGNQSLGSFLRQWKKVLLAHAQQVLNSLVLCQAQRNGCQSIGWVKFPEKNYSKWKYYHLLKERYLPSFSLGRKNSLRYWLQRQMEKGKKQIKLQAMCNSYGERNSIGFCKLLGQSPSTELGSNHRQAILHLRTPDFVCTLPVNTLTSKSLIKFCIASLTRVSWPRPTTGMSGTWIN